jgi:hypothetical protein
MASSEIEIWKLALSKIGNTNFPATPTDQTPEAQVCAVLFPTWRDATLEAADWPFATRRATLAALTESRTGWLYTYAYPSDCVKIIGGVSELGKNLPVDLREEFDIEMGASADSLVVVANVEAFEVLYVSRAIAIGKWPGLFVDALVTGMASELALAIKKDVAMAGALRSEYRYRLGEATASQFRQSQFGPDYDSPILRSRS